MQWTLTQTVANWHNIKTGQAKLPQQRLTFEPAKSLFSYSLMAYTKVVANCNAR
jgi:hypothetical protein